jgi:hypothetical protein
VRIALPVVVSGLLTTQALAADLRVNIEIPVLNVAEYHRPYVALWIERSNQSVAANLAVWFDLKQKTTWRSPRRTGRQ